MGRSMGVQWVEVACSTRQCEGAYLLFMSDLPHQCVGGDVSVQWDLVHQTKSRSGPRAVVSTLLFTKGTVSQRPSTWHSVRTFQAEACTHARMHVQACAHAVGVRGLTTHPEQHVRIVYCTLYYIYRSMIYRYTIQYGINYMGLPTHPELHVGGQGVGVQRGGQHAVRCGNTWGYEL